MVGALLQKVDFITFGFINWRSSFSDPKEKMTDRQGEAQMIGLIPRHLNYRKPAACVTINISRTNYR